MQKTIIIILCFLLLTLTPLISAESCSADSGYNRCYHWPYSDIGMSVDPTVMSNSNIQVENGEKYGDYVTGKAYLPYKFKGDGALYENIDSWSKFWDIADSGYECGGGDCRIDWDGSHESLRGSGRYYVTKSTGDTYTDCPIFAVAEVDNNNKGGIASSGAWGWTSDGNCFDIKQVDCYKDKDCYSNEYCDKSGDWKDWSCEVKECEKGETKCEGNDYYTCDTSDYTWQKEGIKKGECGVECKDDSHCDEDEFVGESFCSDVDEVSQTYRDYYCTDDYKCDYDEEDKVTDECEDVCEDGECIERSFLEKYGVAIIVGIVGLTILGFIVLILRKLF